MHDRVVCDLSQRRCRIGRATLLALAGREVDGGPVVGLQFVVEAGELAGDRARASCLVHYITREIGARDARELNVRAGDEVLRPDAKDQQPDNRRGRLVHRSDHLGRRQAFVRGPVVGGEQFAVEGPGQILFLESPQVQIGERCVGNGLHIEWGVPMPPPLVQDPLILGVGDGPAGPDADPDLAPCAHWRGVRWLDRNDCHVASGKGAFRDGHCGRGKGIAVGLDVRQSLQQTVRDLDAGGRPVVAHPYEHDSGAAVAREVVGERADGLPDLLDGAVLLRRGFRERLIPLDQLGLDVGHHGLELLVGVGAGHFGGFTPLTALGRGCCEWLSSREGGGVARRGGVQGLRRMSAIAWESISIRR